MGWVDSGSLLKKNQENGVLNQEIARLTEKNKKLGGQIEEIKKDKQDWLEKEGKYKKVVENFKSTIAELSKKVANAESNKQILQTFEDLLQTQRESSSTCKAELAILADVCNELTVENQLLKEERLRRRNQPASYLLSSLRMFEEF